MVERTVLLPVKVIERDPGQPRKTFKAGELRALAENIAAVGLLQPIMVRPIWRCEAGHESPVKASEAKRWFARVPRPCQLGREEAAARAVIVMGERRWRACTLAKVATMAAVVKFEVPRLREIQLVENLLRQDIEPLELAQALKDLVDQGATPADLARRLGRQALNPGGWVEDRVGLLKLIPMCKEALRIGVLSVDKAIHMSRLSPEAQHGAFLALRDGKIGAGTSVQLYCEAIQAVEAQGALFTLPKESKKAREAMDKFDLVLWRLVQLVRSSMDEDTLQVLSRVTDVNVAGRLHQLDLLLRHIRRMRQALVMARVTGAIATRK